MLRRSLLSALACQRCAAPLPGNLTTDLQIVAEAGSRSISRIAELRVGRSLAGPEVAASPKDTTAGKIGDLGGANRLGVHEKRQKATPVGCSQATPLSLDSAHSSLACESCTSYAKRKRAGGRPFWSTIDHVDSGPAGPSILREFFLY